VPATSHDPIAAIDLGSNSFHMIVARPKNGGLHVLDRLREMVRLAAGLDEERRLDPQVMERALECLARFGQRLSHLPPGNVRAVGTNTLRSARNANHFLAAAEEALGHPIEIISGVEEARLIFLGVAHSMADDGKQRLVVDIGGGSTELITGVHFEPSRMESLYMGCVSMSRRHFADGRITRKAVRAAELAARLELEPHESHFRGAGWEEVVGASGTIRTIDRVARENGWGEDGITPDALRKMVEAMLKAGHVDRLKLPGLSAKRRPVFPGGLMVLLATFEALGIERMQVADGALREGLLYDHMGRIRHEDVRARTVESLGATYHVDGAQAERVTNTAAAALRQVSQGWSLQDSDYRPMLGWAAALHEVGLAIAHNQYQKHGAYILANADMPGFSQQEQRILAALVRSHRRKFPDALFTELPRSWHDPARRLAILLRLAAVLHRSRNPAPLPPFQLTAPDAKTLVLQLPPGWLDDHPLTCADLEQEAAYLTGVGFRLGFS